MEELKTRLQDILNDEYSCTQLKNWLDGESTMIDFIIDELENESITIDEATDRLSCYLNN